MKLAVTLSGSRGRACLAKRFFQLRMNHCMRIWIAFQSFLGWSFLFVSLNTNLKVFF